MTIELIESYTDGFRVPISPTEFSRSWGKREYRATQGDVISTGKTRLEAIERCLEAIK